MNSGSLQPAHMVSVLKPGRETTMQYIIVALLNTVAPEPEPVPVPAP